MAVQLISRIHLKNNFGLFHDRDNNNYLFDKLFIVSGEEARKFHVEIKLDKL